MRGMDQGSRAVTVAQTTAGGLATPITAPCRLLGWSLAGLDVDGLSASGLAAAPAAGTALCTIAAVPAGLYTVNWQFGFGGTLGAGDQNNMGLYVNGVLVAVGSDRQSGSQFIQNQIQVVIPPGGVNVTVQAIGNATAGSTYVAAVTLGAGPAAECQILDGTQQLGVVSIQPGSSDTEILTADGVYVSGAITVKVTAGTIYGVLYVADNTDPT